MNKVVVRTRALKPGDVVIVRGNHGAYQFPEGLAENTTVTVVRISAEYADVVDANGHPWTVAFAYIQMPCSLWWKGQWIDYMTHPEGETAWQAFLQQAAAAANATSEKKSLRQ